MGILNRVPEGIVLVGYMYIPPLQRSGGQPPLPLGRLPIWERVLSLPSRLARSQWCVMFE